MTKEERVKKRDQEIDAMIDRYDMERYCDMTREQIRRCVQRGMVANNLAFVLADTANTFLMDCEGDLRKLGVGFGYNDKYNFNQMMRHITAARKWAAKSALPIYELKEETDDACADSDWWYHMARLIDDRLGDDRRKTNMLLEFLLQMPSEVGLFKVTYDDFKRFKKDTK